MSEFWKDKVAVVTGASRGLGKAMAIALAKEGVAVALVGRDREKLAESQKEAAAFGVSAEIFTADVTDEAQVRALRESVQQKFQRVHILINNAGVNLRKPITDFTLEEWRHVIDSNLTSTFLMCRDFVPLMRGHGYGRIINLTSIMSHVSLPERTAYSSSKAALLGFTKALALELAPDRITVNGISPGPFATEMNAPLMNDPERNAAFLAKLPAGAWGKPEDIGSLAVYVCSEAASFLTGTDIVIDGGWTAQ